MNRIITYQVSKAQLTKLKDLRGTGSYNTLTIKIPLKALLAGKDLLKKMYPAPGDIKTINSVGITDALILTCYLNYLVNEKTDTDAYFMFMFEVKGKVVGAPQVDSE